MRVVIFSGTTEGRRLSRILAERGAEVTVCVATEYGGEIQGELPGVTVLTGRKSEAEMEDLLRGSQLCVDATHPYAVEVTGHVRAACGRAGVPCRRLLREASGETGGLWVASAAEAAEHLAAKEGNILLATGAKELGAYGQLSPQRLFPRILPSHESLAACEAAGIPHRNIIAMQGPFSQQMNEAVIRQFHIAWVVTKDGGSTGGFPEKAAAARSTGAGLVVIRRQEETGDSFEDIVRGCEEMMRCM